MLGTPRHMAGHGPMLRAIEEQREAHAWRRAQAASLAAAWRAHGGGGGGGGGDGFGAPAMSEVAFAEAGIIDDPSAVSPMAVAVRFCSPAPPMAMDWLGV
jgi:hypothetical protein